MSSLKEIKTRIQSVKSTQKITSAMKMVSAAKLRKAEKAIESLHPYENQLGKLLHSFLSAETEFLSPYSSSREVKRVAIIVLSSNTSLCGSYNANVIKLLAKQFMQYHSLGKDNILLYTIGKKVYQNCVKEGYEPKSNYEELANKPAYAPVSEIADEIMQLFIDNIIDRVELIYHHFKSKSSQVLTCDTLLPIQLDTLKENGLRNDYIVEPNAAVIMNELIPKVLRLKLYNALLDSNASEHAARTIAMQVATDNASDLLQELSLQYNKSRQQAITAELLDIMGGLFK